MLEDKTVGMGVVVPELGIFPIARTSEVAQQIFASGDSPFQTEKWLQGEVAEPEELIARAKMEEAVAIRED